MDWKTAFVALLVIAGSVGFMTSIWHLSAWVESRWNETAGFLVWAIFGAGVLVSLGVGIITGFLPSLRE